MTRPLTRSLAFGVAATVAATLPVPAHAAVTVMYVASIVTSDATPDAVRALIRNCDATEFDVSAGTSYRTYPSDVKMLPNGCRFSVTFPEGVSAPESPVSVTFTRLPALDRIVTVRQIAVAGAPTGSGAPAPPVRVLIEADTTPELCPSAQLSIGGVVDARTTFAEATVATKRACVATYQGVDFVAATAKTLASTDGSRIGEVTISGTPVPFTRLPYVRPIATPTMAPKKPTGDGTSSGSFDPLGAAIAPGSPLPASTTVPRRQP